MSRMLSKLADRLILQPTTDTIDPEQRQRTLIETVSGPIEVWITRSSAIDANVDLLAIKFPGTGGRAERSGPHPFDLNTELCAEVWTVNHAGYGGSNGPATLQNFPATCEAVWQSARGTHPTVPIAVVGNSLGCLSALYLAARKETAGIFLRNPVPLQQLISTRAKYNWWNFGLARWIARQVPIELDAVENARHANCPLLLIRSERDRVAPAKYQKMIYDPYAGTKSEFVVKDADHHDRIPESQLEEYKKSVINWIDQIVDRSQ